MAKHSSRHRRSRSRKYRGGSYTSASTYGSYVNGSGNEQYNRVFDQAGVYGQVQGNALIGAQGQNTIPAARIPNASQLSLVQSAGRRRRRGGLIGEIVNQAVVPLGLIGLQQTYRRKKGGRKTRKHRKH